MRVVCVDNRAHPELVRGATYTIVGFEPWSNDWRFDGPITDDREGIVLAEVHNPTWDGEEAKHCVGYSARRFRPLVDDSDEAQERDAALFREWLKVPHLSSTERAPSVDA